MTILFRRVRWSGRFVYILLALVALTTIACNGRADTAELTTVRQIPELMRAFDVDGLAIAAVSGSYGWTATQTGTEKVDLANCYITVFFIGLFALLQLPITMAVGIRHNQEDIMFLHGDDETLLRRIRAHANFTETVPMTSLPG